MTSDVELRSIVPPTDIGFLLTDVGTFWVRGWIKPGIGPQVLVFGSIYRGFPRFGARLFLTHCDLRPGAPESNRLPTPEARRALEAWLHCMIDADGEARRLVSLGSSEAVVPCFGWFGLVAVFCRVWFGWFALLLSVWFDLLLCVVVFVFLLSCSLACVCV